MLIILLTKQIVILKLQKLKINLLTITTIYIDTSGFDKLAANVFNAKIAQANLKTKPEFDSRLLSHNRKITTNKTKH